MSETDTPTPTAEPEHSPAEEQTSAAKMHNFSEYVHVGPGAEECPHATDGKCAEREHFHGWVRLPNPFEKKSIDDKAAAAEARKLRSYRDADSNDSVILDNDIAGLQAAGDREVLIEEIVGADFLQDHLRAVNELAEEDEKEDGEWATIEEDRERWNALGAKQPDDRDEEEFAKLGERISEHAQLVNTRRDEIQVPRRQALADTSIEDLATMVRQLRVDGMANGIRREEKLKWEMYICTLKPKDPNKPGFPIERCFSSIDAFVSGPPEVLEVIAETVTKLNRESATHLKG
jgi:hypothetical protein